MWHSRYVNLGLSVILALTLSMTLLKAITVWVWLCGCGCVGVAVDIAITFTSRCGLWCLLRYALSPQMARLSVCVFVHYYSLKYTVLEEPFLPLA